MRVRLSASAGPDFSAELFPHPVAAEFVSRLPVTLTFSDFNGVEKVATLDSPLSVAGVPDADSPQPGEIGYYAPTRGIVLYYGHVGQWPGLVRLGTLDLPVEGIRALPDGISIRITSLSDEA